MCHSVITGKENASKESNCIIARVLTSFNVYFLIGYGYFVCICCKTAIWLFWDNACFFSEDRLVTLCRSPLRKVCWWPSIACALFSEPVCFEITMDMRKWIQHPFRSDSQPMSSSQDKLQLQKTSVLDRVDNNETVVAPDDLGEDRPKQVRLQKYRAAFFG